MLNSLQSDQGFDLSPPPVGRVTKIQHIIDNVRNHIENTQTPSGKTVLGIGYSDIALEENRHPNKHDLDKIATDRAILMLHSSMHIMAINSYALKACNLTYETIPH
jgi:predicted amidohydrolase YtcJ